MSVEMLQVIILAVIVIVGTNAIASKLGVAGPLLLVLIGVLVSLLPFVPPIMVQPQVILVGVLPPLLYSAATSAPAIEFRRDFGVISGLSVVLVVISALVLGVFFTWMIPTLSFPFAVALGAILSPTDAVATTIVQRLGVSPRVVTVLQGESLLNDATALVLLRTAIAAAAASFSIWTTLGSFAWAVLSAVVIGAAVGYISLRVRAWVGNPVANTALGFTVPFLAYLPTDAVGGSGLVASVVAGIVVGQGSLSRLTSTQRISDKLNWRTVEFVFEGAVFLIMGLELYGILEDSRAADQGLLQAAGLAAAALVILLVVRALYVAPLIRVHTWFVKRRARARLRALGRDRAGRSRADIEYFETAPLAWRQTVMVVWAGMRGVVTLAAAQTLPRETPERDLLVLVAFLVATGSLLVQGMTLAPLARWLGIRETGEDTGERDEVRTLVGSLMSSVRAATADGRLRRSDSTAFPLEYAGRDDPDSAGYFVVAFGDVEPDREEFELAALQFMREQLRRSAKTGRYSSDAIRQVLDELDAAESSVHLRAGGES